MFLMKRALSYRRAQHELFATGDYQPLLAAGSRKDHVIAFSRTWRSKTVIVAVGRFFSRLGAANRLPIGPAIWDRSFIPLEKKMRFNRYRNVITGEELSPKIQDDQYGPDGQYGQYGLPLGQVFSLIPAAMIEQYK